ncbi:MAG: hypothetical protein LC637_03175, partial [Xanthomonadaceae bacterium]|nr:hypothetical protein [Xanthomonadaceae bacterium]
MAPAFVMGLKIQQWLGLAALALACGLMLADLFKLRQAHELESPFSPGALNWPQPWSGYAARHWVRQAGSDWRRNPDAAAAILAAGAPLYPMDSLQWLDQAAIQAALQHQDLAETSLLKALAVQPARREVLWSAVQIALQTGSEPLAEGLLRQWLQGHPRDTEQALFVARRWITRPEALLERLLPDGRLYLEQAMAAALRHRDAALAEAVWHKLESRAGLGDPVFLQYVELLIELDKIDSAAALWAAQDPDWRDGPLDHRLVNGQFTRPLTDQLGFAWRTTGAPGGVYIERDPVQWLSDPASLRISFNGKENVRLAAPSIRLPVQPGERYRLTGAWRAEALTTRALPYLHLGNRPR